ncbi:MAG TPA: hemerythrin domain-containing protein [Acidobacteriota bacterium]|nr:hemerythrin domain-containing protein [Acidobacteriota bacterium]
MRVTEALSQEHQTVLKQLDLFEEALQKFDEGGIRGTMRFFDERIVLHRRKEEEVLFPVVGRHIGLEHGPIAHMLEEHRIEKQRIEQIREALTRLPDPHAKESIRAAGYAILDLLRAHIEKEDTILFPLSEEMMTPEEKSGVHEGFEAIGYCY